MRFWSAALARVVARAAVTVVAAAAGAPTAAIPASAPTAVASPSSVTAGQSFSVVFSGFRGDPSGTFAGSFDASGRWSPATPSPYNSFTVITDPFRLGFSFPVDQSYAPGVRTLRFYVGGATYDVTVTLR